MRSLKKRAADLGIDTSHFTRQRTWSDRHLRQAVAEATSWTAVLRLLGISDRSRLSVKGHAARLGLDVSHLEPARPERPKELSELEPRLTLLSAGAECFAASWFAVRGVRVAFPTQPASYDLLAVLGDGVRRVQVKTTTCRGRHGSWTVNVGRRPYVLDKTASRSPYGPDEIDYFFIIDGDGAVYLVPSRVLGGRTGINVGAYKQFIVGDASSLFATPSRRYDT